MAPDNFNILNDLPRFKLFRIQSMADGNLALPPQFGGLVSRSGDEFDHPFEVAEIPAISDVTEFQLPPHCEWDLAAEEWASLLLKDRVWHYSNRSNPVAYGQRAYIFWKTFHTQCGEVLVYKLAAGPTVGIPEKMLLFRQVPAPMLINFDLESPWPGLDMKFTALSMAGSEMVELYFGRTERVTWKRLKIELREKLMRFGWITSSRSFRIVHDTPTEPAQNKLVFQPFVEEKADPTDAAHSPNKEMKIVNKKPAASMSKAAASMKKPAGSMKRPAAVKRAAAKK